MTKYQEKLKAKYMSEAMAAANKGDLDIIRRRFTILKQNGIKYSPTNILNKYNEVATRNAN